MKQLLLISDSHGERQRVKRIVKEQGRVDMRFHLGDLGFHPRHLRKFIIVRGNHDPLSYGLADEQIVEVEGCRILLLHGHQLEMQAALRMEQNEESLDFQAFVHCLAEAGAKRAKACGCNVLFHGHTHVPWDQVIDGVHIVNPGSLCFNRGEASVSYACVRIDGGRLTCRFHTLPLQEPSA